MKFYNSIASLNNKMKNSVYMWQTGTMAYVCYVHMSKQFTFPSSLCDVCRSQDISYDSILVNVFLYYFTSIVGIQQQIKKHEWQNFSKLFGNILKSWKMNQKNLFEYLRTIENALRKNENHNLESLLKTQDQQMNNLLQLVFW